MEIPSKAVVDLSNTSYLWPYNTVPQSSLDGRQIPIQRGKVLGGSSAVSTCNVQESFYGLYQNLSDFLFWTRGSQDDFDRYARVTGDSGWSWNSILPYYKKVRDLPNLVTIIFNSISWKLSLHQEMDTTQLVNSIQVFMDFPVLS